MRKYILITLLPVLLYSCKAVNSIATSPASIQLEADYSFVGHVRLECKQHDFEETYDYVLAHAINIYGPGVDVVNITKDYVYDHGFFGWLFPIFFRSDVYLNAFVIKYDKADNIKYIDITDKELDEDSPSDSDVTDEIEHNQNEDSDENTFDEYDLNEDDVKDQQDDKLSEIRVGDIIQFILDNDYSVTYEGEVIRVIDNTKIAVSYKDSKGRTLRKYVKTEDVIVE